MLTFKYNTQFSRLIWVLVTGIFVLDLLIPRNYDIVFAYLLAHFLAIFFKEKSDVLLLAVVTTVLTIIGLVPKPHDAPFQNMLLERAPAIVSFWAAAYFVLRFIQLREDESLQEGRFEALFQFATNGILMTNKQGAIVMANPAIEQLFGYDKNEMIGKPIESLIPQRFAKNHVAHRTEYQSQPQPRNMGTGLSLQGLKRDGTEFPVEVSLSPFKHEQGEFVVAFVIDNTFRKNYEKSILKQKQELSILSSALQELNESLENKVTERTLELEKAKNELSVALEKERELGELKSRFVSMASHEFRTPLTAVLSSAGLVHQYASREDFANVQKHAERIKNAVNGLNTILTEFLSLGRLEEGRISVNREKTTVADCVSEVVEGLQNLIKPGQKLQHEHDGNPEVYIDCNLTKNILINLVSNAIKYSPENAHIRIVSKAQNDRIHIAVHDRGMGIPESEQKHLFDRFFRASNAANSTQGTGLGLYIVQRYAEMMGGTVGFESVVEEGSVFWVELEAPAAPHG
jgi:PAS domain S-box-containing protein